jgi:hypothetical protein
VTVGECGGAEWDGCAFAFVSLLAFASAFAFTSAFACAFASLEAGGVGDAGPTSKAETWLLRAVAHETTS